MNQGKKYQIDKGRRLAGRITKGFARYKVEIDIKKKFNMQGAMFIFQIRLKGATRKHQIYDCLDDVRQVLGLYTLQIHEENIKIFITASEQGVVSNNLINALKSLQFLEAKKQMEIPYAVGCDAVGKIIIVNLKDLPHLIIGGSTKMGKTVALWCLLSSIIIGCHPDKVSLFVFDGASNLTMFERFPHLIYPVIQDPAIGFEMIIALEQEMVYRLEQKTGVDSRFYPLRVCVVDEFSSLVDGLDKAEIKRLSSSIAHLTRRGRQADIYLILAIHNPIKDNTGGCDLNSVTARMAFKCSTTAQSVALINNDKAKKLTRKGEMIFRLSEDEQLHLQGAFISPPELEQVLDHARSYWNRHTPSSTVKQISTAVAGITNEPEKIILQNPLLEPPKSFTGKTIKSKLSEDDKLFAQIILWTLGRESISCRLIEDTFRIGYRSS
jgi:S-DNA-T family DNA segregation ATPase FtsK/SpoIIIE